ncbi:GntR family transcriptional regulator [Paeniglutamicibacter sp.]|uniref:GntR family transcriptional regulator n=1 Tax=Paeniglutamicibacter sp. TaxID=1934391 RepID=UPI003989A933
MNRPKTSATDVSGRRIADEMRDSILQGEYQPGTRMGQEMLAERFKASRMPVREALRQLESEGLVSIVPHSGAWVAKLDPFEFDQTYKLREAVEPLAIRESIPHLDDQQKQRILELAREIEANAKSEESIDVERFLDLDRQFHLLTYAGVRSQYLNEVVQRLWNTTQHYRRVLMTSLPTEQLEATNADHFLIADSVRRGDAEAAATLVQLHIRRTRSNLSPITSMM